MNNGQIPLRWENPEVLISQGLIWRAVSKHNFQTELCQGEEIALGTALLEAMCSASNSSAHCLTTAASSRSHSAPCVFNAQHVRPSTSTYLSTGERTCSPHWKSASPLRFQRLEQPHEIVNKVVLSVSRNSFPCCPQVPFRPSVIPLVLGMSG